MNKGMNIRAFGKYWHKTFADVFPSEEVFLELFDSCRIPKMINNNSASTLYYLLYARYANDVIANSDENQFIYSVFSTIFMYGPTWEKRIEIQQAIRTLNMDDITLSSISINNQALNSAMENITTLDEEMSGVNSQSAYKVRKGKLSAYAMLSELIKTDVTRDFIIKFKSLFRVIIEPDEELFYTDEE